MEIYDLFMVCLYVVFYFMISHCQNSFDTCVAIFKLHQNHTYPPVVFKFTLKFGKCLYLFLVFVDVIRKCDCRAIAGDSIPGGWIAGGVII